MNKDDRRLQPILLGIMSTAVQQAGTQLRLQQAQLVSMQLATNVPSKSVEQFYARPFNGFWDGAPEQAHDTSILVDAYEVCPVTPEQAAKFRKVLECQGADKLKKVWNEYGREGALICEFEHITIGIEQNGYNHS